MCQLHLNPIARDVLKLCSNGRARFFTLSLKIDVATEMLSQFVMPRKSIDIKNFCPNEQKCISNNSCINFVLISLSHLPSQSCPLKAQFFIIKSCSVPLTYNQVIMPIDYDNQYNFHSNRRDQRFLIIGIML